MDTLLQEVADEAVPSRTDSNWMLVTVHVIKPIIPQTQFFQELIGKELSGYVWCNNGIPQGKCYTNINGKELVLETWEFVFAKPAPASTTV
jgi:hypothetical protein